MKAVVGVLLFSSSVASSSVIPSAFHRTTPPAAIFGASRRSSLVTGGRLVSRDVPTPAIPLRPLGGAFSPITAHASSSSPTSSSSSTSTVAAAGGVMATLRSTTGGATTSTGGNFSFSALWGVFGVIAVLSNAIRRLLPIALEPFKAGNFTPILWAQYIGFALFMAYAEGYKGFQLKFSPLVVKRAYTLGPKAPLLHKIFAAPYSMGLFHANNKRKIVSWTLALGIVGLVKLVKGLSYPYRSIVDAGVVVGLSYGTLSIAGIYIGALMGRMPAIDPALPEAGEKKA